MVSILILFIAGLILDVLWSLLVVAIDDGRPWLAAVYQCGFTVLGVGATWYAISAASLTGLFGYALGGAVGTYYVVKYRERSRIR